MHDRLAAIEAIAEQRELYLRRRDEREAARQRVDRSAREAAMAAAKIGPPKPKPPRLHRISDQGLRELHERCFWRLRCRRASESQHEFNQGAQ
jgi:hypothetical protein